ncbi:MAG TPA: hypothetical protein VIP98_12465 [Microlunatus sp.]
MRARKLLFGGLAGGVGMAILCLIIFTVLDGARGLGSAALGAGMVLFFYTVGQLVMVAFADAGARTLMAVSMASYTGRVVILGLILMIFEKNRDAWNAIDAKTIFITTIAVIVGWLVVEVMVFRKLRIGIYDTEYTGPTDGESAESTDPTGTEVDAGPSARELAADGSWDPHREPADQPESVTSPQREEGNG